MFTLRMIGLHAGTLFNSELIMRLYRIHSELDDSSFRSENTEKSGRGKDSSGDFVNGSVVLLTKNPKNEQNETITKVYMERPTGNDNNAEVGNESSRREGEPLQRRK